MWLISLKSEKNNQSPMKSAKITVIYPYYDYPQKENSTFFLPGIWLNFSHISLWEQINKKY